jgi:Tfp pilus assembly protein PilF
MRRFLLATCLLVSPLLAQDPPSASTVDELVRSAQMHATMAQRARTAQEAQQRLQLSLTSYEQALAAGAGAPVVLNQMAQLYLMSGNTERAIALFHRSLAEDPQKLATYSGLNDAFFALGRIDSSIHYVEAAKQIAPDNAGVRVQLGFLYLQGGARATARAQLDSALMLDPNHPQAHKLLGLWLTQAQQIDSAIVVYQHVVELQPDDVEAHNNVAFLLAGKARYAEALEWYKKTKLLSSDPQLLHAVNLNMEGIRAIMAGKMRARYILVETQASCEQVASKAAAGEEFGELAAQFSIAPNAAEGGDLGFFGPGDMVSAVEEAVLGLAVGEVSAVIPIGRHFMLLERLN